MKKSSFFSRGDGSKSSIASHDSINLSQLDDNQRLFIIDKNKIKREIKIDPKDLKKLIEKKMKKSRHSSSQGRSKSSEFSSHSSFLSSSKKSSQQINGSRKNSRAIVGDISSDEDVQYEKVNNDNDEEVKEN
jgi:hypothetical protein